MLEEPSARVCVIGIGTDGRRARLLFFGWLDVGIIRTDSCRALIKASEIVSGGAGKFICAVCVWTAALSWHESQGKNVGQRRGGRNCFLVEAQKGGSHFWMLEYRK